MPGSNRFTVNESTSVIKIDKSVLLNGNPTFVDLSNSALPGQIVTVFDADGIASPTYPIWISSVNADITFISSVDGTVSIQQRFGYVTLNSVSPTKWSIIASDTLSEQQTDYSVKGLASFSTSVNTINATNFVSSGRAFINTLDINESLSINQPLYASTLYINAYQSYISTSSADPLLTINDIMDLNSTTSIKRGLYITDSISTGGSVFVGTILSTFGPAIVSSLNVGVNTTVLGNITGSNTLSVGGYTSISSITTLNGSLSVGNNVQAQTIGMKQINANMIGVTNKLVLGQATLLNASPYIATDTSLYSPTVTLGTVSTINVSTGQLIVSSFSPTTTSLKTISFANTSILNQSGSLTISSIRANTSVIASNTLSYGMLISSINTSSVAVKSSISTTGTGTTQMSTLSLQSSGMIVAATNATRISSIATANTLTVQGMVADQLNTAFTSISVPVISSVISRYVAPIASGYQIESDTYGIFNGAPFPAAGSVIRIKNVSNENITSITITDSSSSSYTHPSILRANTSFNLTVGNIYFDVESNGYLQIQMASASRSLTGKLVRIPTATGDVLQLQTIPTTTSIVATGGTVTTGGQRKCHTFTTNGTFTISATTGVIVEVMMIGGGGGGGGWSGGGGGAGNVIVFAAPLGVGSYSVTVGNGGAGGVGADGASSQGSNGQSTTFGSIATALGGGGGGTYSAGGGKNGGCGGGGAELTPGYYLPGAGVTGSVSTGTVVRNSAAAGGTGRIYDGNSAGAGGGGVSGVGGDVTYPPANGGNGGAGFQYISGNQALELGGGGGGCASGITYWSANPVAGIGGLGGGGNGADYVNSILAVDGAPNTGGGGGGGTFGTYGNYGGANGGSGIVIVSYSLVGSGSFSIISMETVTTSAVNIIPSTITSTTTVSYQTPGEYVWTAPAGVSTVFLSLTGGGGGGGNQSPSNVYGGAGGALSGYMPVTPGCNYTLEVGGGGGAGGTAQIYNSAGAGGYPGGGTPSIQDRYYPYSGGGGGGYSAISLAGTYLAIAGAGGGNAGIDSGYGGAGGGLVGQDGQNPGGGGSQTMGGLGFGRYNIIYAYDDNGGYLFGGASGMGGTMVDQHEGGGGAGYYGGGAGLGGGGGSSYISTGALTSVTNIQGGGGAGGRGGTPGEPGRDGSITLSYSGRSPSLTIGAGYPITLTTSDVYNGGSLYWQMALPAITDSGAMFTVGTDALSFSLISYGSSYIFASAIMDSPLLYSPGDLLSVYSDGSTASSSNYGTAYVYLSSILIATLPSYLNTSPQYLNIAKTQSTTNSYAFSNVLFGPAQIIYTPSTIFFSTINSNTVIDYVSIQNTYVTMNSLIYASTANVDSVVSTTKLTSVSTLRAPSPFSYLTIGPTVTTNLISSSVLNTSTMNASTFIVSTSKFMTISSMSKQIGATITRPSTTPYLTAFDVTNYYNPTVPSLSPGYFPYYYMSGTLQSNVALSRNEIIGGTSYEHSILKADAYAATGLVVDWFLLNPTTYSNAYLNLRFSQAHASGNISINGNVIFTFDSMIGSNTTSITLNDFSIKTYPMYVTNSRGYPSMTPWVELTYYANNGVLPTKFPLMEVWVSDKKIAQDTSSRLDTRGLVTMNKGYMYFSTPVNGINIFNSQNDMSVRRLFYTGAMSFASDPILKEQIEPANLEICRQTVDDLPLHRYKYIDAYQSTFQLADTRRLGVLSSEYGRHFPKAITYSPEQVLPGISTTAMIDTEQLMYSHIGATQLLISTVEHLSTLLVTLRKERDRRRTVTT